VPRVATGLTAEAASWCSVRWKTQRVAQARKSAIFLIMFGVVIMVSGCSRAEVKPGSQVSSSAWESLPISSASAVVPQAAPTAITVRPNECPDVSGHDFAEAGVLSAGSFTAEDIGPPAREAGWPQSLDRLPAQRSR
jgi:hypothetical protein